jgi:hypothetical protein
MLFSEPIKAIPKRWMHFRSANIYFEVWKTRHTGLAIEAGLSQCRRLQTLDQYAIMSGRKWHLWLTETFSFLAISFVQRTICQGLRRLHGVRGVNSARGIG